MNSQTSVKQAPNTKKTQISWATEVPSHWSVVRLKDVATVVNGYPFDSALFHPTDGMPLVRIRDISRGFTEAYYTGEPVAEALIERGDVVIGMDGDFNVAKWSGVQALLNQRLCVVRASSSALERYIYYVLPVPLKIINELTYATTVKHLSSFDVEKLRIPLPPLTELRQIVKFLDNETAEADTLVAKYERLIKLLEEKRVALAMQAVKKGLDPDVPMKESGIVSIGTVPSHWSVRPLKHFFTILDGKRIPLNSEERSLRKGPYPYYGASGVIDNVDDYIFDEDLVLVGEDGANLVNRVTPLAFVARGRYWVNNHAHILRPKQYDSLLFWAERIEVESIASVITGSAQPKLTIEALKNLIISGPPSESERCSIVKHLETINNNAAILKSKAQRAIELIAERRAALITAAVTGKIDIRPSSPPDQLATAAI